jgi:hypothetical protein
MGTKHVRQGPSDPAVAFVLGAGKEAENSGERRKAPKIGTKAGAA